MERNHKSASVWVDVGLKITMQIFTKPNKIQLALLQSTWNGSNKCKIGFNQQTNAVVWNYFDLDTSEPMCANENVIAFVHIFRHVVSVSHTMCRKQCWKLINLGDKNAWNEVEHGKLLARTREAFVRLHFKMHILGKFTSRFLPLFLFFSHAHSTLFHFWGEFSFKRCYVRTSKVMHTVFCEKRSTGTKSESENENEKKKIEKVKKPKNGVCYSHRKWI